MKTLLGNFSTKGRGENITTRMLNKTFYEADKCSGKKMKHNGSLHSYLYILRKSLIQLEQQHCVSFIKMCMHEVSGRAHTGK
jgi:hypothetical protein